MLAWLGSSGSSAGSVRPRFCSFHSGRNRRRRLESVTTSSAPRGGLCAQLGGGEVARVQQRPALGQRAERGERRDAVRAAVDDDRALRGLDVHDAASGAKVIAADLWLDRGRAEVTACRRQRPTRPVCAIRAAKPLACERAGGDRRVDRAAALDVVIRAGDHCAHAEQPQERPQLPG
jgi:hypothetical protein